MQTQFPSSAAPRLLRSGVSQPLGQVQIELEGRPLFATSESLSFLGDEAAHTIGGGARWRHPYPQTWSWPPREPSQVQLPSGPDLHNATVDEPTFVKEYASKPTLAVKEQVDGTLALEASLENLKGAEKQAWIVAPFAMPEGHLAHSPKALAVFPASQAELDAIPDGASGPSRWEEDAENSLLFVNPGGAKAEGQEDKLLLTDRWSAFAREGDSALLLMPATKTEGDEAFQVYAAFDGYLEMEWAGKAAGPGETSQVTATFQPVPLSSLDLTGFDGSPLHHFGESGRGLQQEITQALSALGVCRSNLPSRKLVHYCPCD